VNFHKQHKQKNVNEILLLHKVEFRELCFPCTRMYICKYVHMYVCVCIYVCMYVCGTKLLNE
jgi:hypothetical protein